MAPGTAGLCLMSGWKLFHHTALNIACSHTVAGIELVAPERSPHKHQGTEQLSASVPGRGGREAAGFPSPQLAVPLAPSGPPHCNWLSSPASHFSLEEIYVWVEL